MSAETACPSALDIAQRAQELKLVYLGSTVALATLLDPRLPILQWELARAGVGPSEDMPVILTDHTPDGDLAFSLRELLAKVATLRGDILSRDLMAGWMLLGAIRLGDMIKNGGHHRTDVPLLEFARHFRNACAHGDRWFFLKDEPRNPAAARGLELTADLHGRRATWQTVTPRRHVEYLDDLTNYFIPGAVSPPLAVDKW